MKQERRHHPRSPVSWPARLWLGIDVYAIARAVDASARGIRLNASDRVRSFLRVGDPYRLEISPDANTPVVYTAEIRHVGEAGVGLELQEELTLPRPAASGGASAPQEGTVRAGRAAAEGTRAAGCARPDLAIFRRGERPR